jgi:hypothetical protein
MSSAYSKKGANGLDDLHQLVSEFVSKLVEIVCSFEGDVIAFAGDAIICVFDESAGGAVVRAVLCAQALITASSLFEMSKHPLRSHIGLSYGDMSLATLGGVGTHWVYLLNGPCLSQLHSCVDDALLDQVVVTPELYRRLVTASDSHVGLREGETIESQVLQPSLNRLVKSIDAAFDVIHPDRRLDSVSEYPA